MNETSQTHVFALKWQVMINEIQVVADFTQICYNKILFPIKIVIRIF